MNAKRLFLIFILSSLAPFKSVFSNEVAEFDHYGGSTAIRGEATGYFHVETIKSRSYLITPLGNGFISLGVTHTIDAIQKDPLGIFATAYQGNPTEYTTSVVNNLRSWNFNSGGYGIIDQMKQQMPYVAIINTVGPLSLSQPNKEYVDIFDPSTWEMLYAAINETVNAEKENPYLIGYLFMDVPMWENDFATLKGGLSYVSFYRQLPGSARGKIAYVNFLKYKYANDIALFNAEYKYNAASFDDLRDDTFASLDLTLPAVRSDDEKFLGRIANKYYSIICRRIRESDPHHLILGDRFMGSPTRTYDSIITIAAKYVDVISFQPMSSKTFDSVYYDAIHAMTQKPIFFADVNVRGRNDTPDEQTLWGESYRDYLKAAFKTSYIIGLHHCTYKDYKLLDPTVFRRGLLHDDESPYPIYDQYVTDANEMVYEELYH